MGTRGRGLQPRLGKQGRTLCTSEDVNVMISFGPVAVDEAEVAVIRRRYHVRGLAVFGSAARGEMRQDSDIDVLIEFQPEAEIGLLEYAGLMLDLSDLMGHRVELVSRNGLKPLIRDSVLQEARPVYAA